MVWTAETSCGRESTKISTIAVPYIQGKCLDIGCGTEKAFPGLIGVDSLKDYGGQRPPAVDIVADGDNLSMFADKSMDGVFSSHFLEHVVDYKSCLKEWWRVIKTGGYLTLYLPHKELYPNIGKPGSNPDHKHDFAPEDILSSMKEIGSWELLENEKRDRGNEYSFYLVFKKIEGKNKHKFKVWERNPAGKKRCLVIRYGAIGDHLMVSSILPQLKKQGYFVTYNTTPSGRDVLQSDPNIDEWWLQEKDFVPNHELGPYWQTMKFEGRYDKIINLCESIEGALLTLPGRLQHDYPDEARKQMFGTVNYLERTHDIAAVPHDFNQRFYPTDDEKSWAKKQIQAIDAPVVAWAINGSAQHKVYPWVQVVTSWLLEHTPAHVFLLADPAIGVDLQNGILETLKKDGIDISKIHPMAGKWSIREALSFVQYADCVVGPETGTLNSVGMEEVPKVIYLSHSTKENLTKHWKNTTTLEPDKAKAPCWPCSRLHYTWEHCHQDKSTMAAVCASSIPPKLVFESIVKALKLNKMEKPKIIEKPDFTPDGTNSKRKAA